MRPAERQVRTDGGHDLLAGIEPAPEWMAEAVCAQTDPELFFPEKGGDGTCTTSIARRVCASCPVRVACLEHALDTGQAHGVWGGKTPRERREIRHRRANDSQERTAA